MKNMHWIWNYIKNQKFFYFTSIILLIIESISFVYSITLQQYIIDQIIMGSDFGGILKYVLLIALCYLIFIMLFVVNPYIQSKIHGRIKYQLVEQGLSTLYSTPINIIQKERNARYVHFFTNEIPIVARLIGEDITDIIKHFVSTIIICVLFLKASPILFFSILILSLFYIKTGKKLSNEQKKVSKDIQNKKSSLLIVLEECITSTRDVIANNRGDWEKARYQNRFIQYFKCIMMEGKLKIKMVFSLESITSIAQIIVIGYGGYLVFKGVMSIGLLVVIYQLTLELLHSFVKVYNLVFSFSGKMASVENISNWLNTKPKRTDNTKTISSIESLTINNISFRYNSGEKFILKNFSIDIPVGKKIALVGLSGSGKSTIGSLLESLYEVEEGSIMANNININDISNDTWKSKVSIVFQDPYIFPGTIRDNLLLGYNRITDNQIIDLAKAMCIDNFIQKLPDKYDSSLGERGITISGGEKQRLALVRALIRDPEVLILDESTSALDVNTEKIIHKNLAMIRENKTTIIIAHRLSTIKDSDIIFVIDKGEIVEQGCHSELLNNKSLYYELVMNEMKDNNSLIYQ
ncbi:ABC transporter ATP-binding protein [Solibacillus daqui]|uniref:ABC transporter ATP-binding protein n=1 Tax=Solibacillus daqui TaxID=2912187 RepID=UPI0023654982|nr:ABC transporter ATP-binding protein [Solibacillus daqui]